MATLADIKTELKKCAIVGCIDQTFYPYTYLIVTTTYRGRTYSASAVSHLHKGKDEYSELRGIEVAKGKAIAKIARKIYESIENQIEEKEKLLSTLDNIRLQTIDDLSALRMLVK